MEVSQAPCLAMCGETVVTASLLSCRCTVDRCALSPIWTDEIAGWVRL